MPSYSDFALYTEVIKPAYSAMADSAIVTALNAQTTPDARPVDADAIRRRAIEARLWGKLLAYGDRAFVGTAAQDVTNAARNFLALLSVLANAPLVRGNALWIAMDADLTVLTTDGVLTVAQANIMRGYGDLTRPMWEPPVTVGAIVTARATFGG